jgi:hypothetical protein
MKMEELLLECMSTSGGPNYRKGLTLKFEVRMETSHLVME